MTAQPLEAKPPPPIDESHSSRTSRSAAGWVDCAASASVKDLYREGYTPRRSGGLARSRCGRPVTIESCACWRSHQQRAHSLGGCDAHEGRHRPGSDCPPLRGREGAVLHDPWRPWRGRRLAVSRPASPLRHRRRDGIHLRRQRCHLPAGDVNEYEDKFFWPYRSLPGPIYAIPGNHDWYDGLTAS